MSALAALGALWLVTAAWWALALWPATATTPGWIARAQYVCFGVGESGLPDGVGWALLIGSPASMLLMWVVGFRQAVAGLWLRLRSGSRARAAALSGLCMVAAGGTLAAARVRSVVDASAPPAVVQSARSVNRTAPSLRLTDQTGTQFDLATRRGRSTIVTFGFAHCTTFCPLVVGNALAAQQLIRLQTPRQYPLVVIVTLDPWRDTLARLPHIARQWELGADAFLLGGSVQQVEAALDSWGVARAQDTRTGDIAHGALTYIVDQQGRITAELIGASAAVIADRVRGS